ncbi:hypothetical protein [Halegenticoccus soli]|uniref:hypothetical protein n=1 Tax=Halegenticoccus soli TaxID=1985678 RepID=UPI000C6D8AC6|nr:hypothetical protein [Halegenticoccus soli]
MSVLGMPTEMFLIFTATLLAGSLGAIHYVTVHVIMGKPVDEYIREEPPTGELTRTGEEPTAGGE